MTMDENCYGSRLHDAIDVTIVVSIDSDRPRDKWQSLSTSLGANKIYKPNQSLPLLLTITD